jgi:hypothetical protein
MPRGDGRTPAHYGIGGWVTCRTLRHARCPYASVPRASVRPGAQHVVMVFAATPTRVGVESGAGSGRRGAPLAGASDPSKTRWRYSPTATGSISVPRSAGEKLCRVYRPWFSFLVEFTRG